MTIKQAGEKWLVPAATLMGAAVSLGTLVGQLPGVSSLGFFYNAVAPQLYGRRVVLVPFLVLLGIAAFIWAIRARRSRTNIFWRMAAAVVVVLLLAAISLIHPAERIVGVLPYVPTVDSQADPATGQALADILRGALHQPDGLVKAVGVSRVAGESLADTGKRAGAQMVVDGTYTLGKGGMQTVTTLYDVASGEVIGSPLVRNILAENLQASQQDVGDALAQQVDVASAIAPKTALATGLDCFNAYECYVIGRRYYLWFNAEGYNRAIGY